MATHRYTCVHRTILVMSTRCPMLCCASPCHRMQVSLCQPLHQATRGLKFTRMQAGQFTMSDRQVVVPNQPSSGPLCPLCFVIGPSLQETGQIEVVLWPQYSIHNELPSPVDYFRLGQELSGERLAPLSPSFNTCV